MKKPANLNTTTGRKVIETELSNVQKGCTARILTIEQIDKICTTVSDNIGISKAALEGTSIHYTGARHFPNAYRYTPECTHFTATYNGRTWIINGIFRAECPNRCTSNTTVILSDTAKTAALAKVEGLNI